MKIRERQVRRMEVNRRIRTSTRNALKCSRGNSEGLFHKATKFWVCNYCWEHCIDFHTEAVFNNMQRADIVIGDWQVCIEVLHTESLTRFDEKRYPFPVIPIPTSMTPERINEMLVELDNTNGGVIEYYQRQLRQEIRDKNRNSKAKDFYELEKIMFKEENIYEKEN